VNSQAYCSYKSYTVLNRKLAEKLQQVTFNYEHTFHGSALSTPSTNGCTGTGTRMGLYDVVAPNARKNHVTCRVNCELKSNYFTSTKQYIAVVLNVCNAIWGVYLYLVELTNRKWPYNQVFDWDYRRWNITLCGSCGTMWGMTCEVRILIEFFQNGSE
jgi:hypothetical protein